MRRSSLAALAAAAALAGCPLPQPLPDYPAGTITPPRVLVDSIEDNAKVVRLVPAGCATPPVYPLTAILHDTNNFETVEARWFVNYEATQRPYYMPVQSNAIPADPDPNVLTRVVPPNHPDTNEPQPLLFRPYDYPPPFGVAPAVGPPYGDAGIARVVELVVSNGFDATALEWPASTLPRRAPLTTPTAFETQVYRWVFVTVPPTTAVPCP